MDRTTPLTTQVIRHPISAIDNTARIGMTASEIGTPREQMAVAMPRRLLKCRAMVTTAVWCIMDPPVTRNPNRAANKIAKFGAAEIEKDASPMA